jgi:lipopolysaccharide biosynthesis regulator YciM/uncharacterized integral membrane protein
MSMMKKAILFVLGVAVILVFLYVFVLNTAGVEVRLTSHQSVSLPLGVLLVGAFVFGLVLTVLAIGLLQAGRSLRTWPARRIERQTTRVAEWERAGNALAWEGDLQRARGLLEKAWRKQPTNASAALALASSYTDTGEHETARRVLTSALSQGAADEDLRFALSEAARRTGDLPEAIRILETVRVQHPKAPRALRHLRSLYRDSGRWQEAAEVQEAYVRSVPSGEPAQAEHQMLTQLRYQAAMSLKNPSARAEALSAVLQAGRTFLPAAVSLGDALVATGRVEDAIKQWDRTLRSLPRTVLIERILAQQSNAKDRQRTVALMKKYQQEMGADCVHVIAARIALEDGDANAAATELDTVTQPALPAVQRLWAKVYRARNEVDQALEALTKLAEETAAQSSGYHCTSCGRVEPEWAGYCPACQSWDTYRSVIKAQSERSA